jgi:amidophosphoribosyltransferase
MPKGCEHLREECGVFGVWSPGQDAARLVYFALKALQHRGQESAGIATADGSTVLVRKGLGLVDQVISQGDIVALSGKAAIGHVRYATSGARDWDCAQPHLSSFGDTTIALAHNGTLVNAGEVRDRLTRQGVTFRSGSDSETATSLIGLKAGQLHSIGAGIRYMMEHLEGGYAIVLLCEDALYAFRDPHGIRPLVLGSLGKLDEGAWVISSETCAFDAIGAHFVREVGPGEIVRVSSEGLSSEQGVPALTEAHCIFEHVYFSRPDSLERNSTMYGMRFLMGRHLAREAPAEADLVIGVPDSGLPPAEGYAAELGIRYGEGFIKNRYVARTFIEPTQSMRELGVRMKLNALRDSVRYKRIVMVDDSIVRGTTMRQLVRMQRDAGAREVHVRIMCPEVRWPCFYGIDTDTQDQLISARHSPEEIRSFIGADSLAFLSLPGLLRCVPSGGYCNACYTGHYPVRIPSRQCEGHFLKGSHPIFPEV